METNVRRWDILAKIIQDNGYINCAEVGVKSGRNIERILAKCPNTHWLAIDPWCPTENYKRWPDESHARNERQFNAVHANHKGNIVKMKMFSLEAVEKVEDASLDLVFIDGDHSYEGVRSDIDAWLPKVRLGGVISGHDYDNTNKYGDAFKGVDRAVHESFGKTFDLYPDHVWVARV